MCGGYKPQLKGIDDVIHVLALAACQPFSQLEPQPFPNLRLHESVSDTICITSVHPLGVPSSLCEFLEERVRLSQSRASMDT